MPLSPNRQDIERELRSGKTPYQVYRMGYNQGTVYKIYHEMLDGRSPGDDDPEETGTEEIQTKTPYRKRSVSRASPGSGSDLISFGNDQNTITEDDIDGVYSQDIVKTVRGVTDVIVRRKVLSIPMPELLYTAMALSIQKWGWTPMRPDDFIDTALDKLIRLTGFEVNSYTDVGELNRLVKFGREHGYTFGNGHNGNGGNGHKEVKPVDKSPDAPVTKTDVDNNPEVEPETTEPKETLTEDGKVVIKSENQTLVLPNKSLKEIADGIAKEQTNLSAASQTLTEPTSEIVPEKTVKPEEFVIKTDDTKKVIESNTTEPTQKAKTIGDLLNGLKM